MPRAKSSTRRRDITAAAADLFAARGYADTGIDDIGAAVGMTGPAVYRHFTGKEEILAAVVRDVVEPVVERVDAIVASTADPQERLERLVGSFVDTVVANPSAFAVMTKERPHLDAETAKLVGTLHARHVAAWVDAVMALSPALSAAEARTIVNGVFGINVVGYLGDRSVGVDYLRNGLRAMALRALEQGPVTLGARPAAPSSRPASSRR